MSINSIKMNLDFHVSAGKAISGLSKLSKGYEGVAKSISDMKLKSDATMLDMSKQTKRVMTALITDLKTGSNIYDAITGSDEGSQPNFIKDFETMAERVGASARDMALAAGLPMASALAQADLAMEDFSKHTLGNFEKVKSAIQSTGVALTTDLAVPFAVKLSKLAESAPGDLAKINEVMAGLEENMNGLKPDQIAKTSAAAHGLVKAFNEDKISSDQLADSLDNLGYATNYLNNEVPKLKAKFGALTSSIRGGLIGVLGVAGVLDDAFSAQAQTVETTHRLALRNSAIFNEGAKSAKNFNGTVMDMNSSIRRVGADTQISMTKAADAMNSLASARVSDVTEDLEKLSITSVRMQQAFGMAEGQAADMFRVLAKSGGLKPDGIEAVGEALADTQAVWGMTSEEATEAGATIGNVINRMSQMGASSIKNAKIVAAEVSRMTTAFTRAGMSASDATQMMDRFMDPTKLEDNALLWHSMGVSVADGLQMMTGDASAMEGMTEGLMNTAKNLREEYGQNPLALQAMAEAHGMTIQQVNMLANELENEANMTDEARKALEKNATLEKQAAQARQSAAEALKRLAAIGNVLLQSFVMPLLDAIMFILNPLMKVISGFANFTSELERAGPIGKTVMSILKGMTGAFLLFLLVSSMNIKKFIPGLNMLKGKKGFGGLFSSIKNGAVAATKSMASFVSKTVKGLTGSLGGAISKSSEAVAGLGAAPKAGAIGKFGIKDMGKMGDTSAIGGKPTAAAAPGKAMEAVSKIPAKQIMQLGAAMALLAAAVFLLAVSFKMLIETMDGKSLGQVSAAMGVMALMMIMLGGAVFILGKFAEASAPGLLILTGSMLMMAGAIALMSFSFAYLLKSMQGMDHIGATIAVFAIAIGGLVAALIVMSFATVSAGPALLFFAGVLLAVGVGIALVGAGFMMMGSGMEKFVNAINNVGTSFGSNAKAIRDGLKIMIPQIKDLGFYGIGAGLSMMMLGIGMKLLGGGTILLAKGMGMITDHLDKVGEMLLWVNTNSVALRGTFGTIADGILIVGLAATIGSIGILVLAVAALAVGGALALAGFGIKMISDSLTTLNKHSNMILPTFGLIAGGILLMALAAKAGWTGLIAVGVAFLAIGAGMALAGLGITALATGFEKLKGMGSEIILIGLQIGGSMVAIAVGIAALGGAFALFGLMATTAVPGLILFGAAVLVLGAAALILNGMGNAFMKMGEGAKLFSSNISSAVTGIGNFRGAMKNFRGDAAQMVEDLNLLNTAFAELSSNAGMSVNAVKTFQSNVKVEPAEDNGATQVTNEILTKIEGHTLRTAIAVEKLADTVKGSKGSSFVATDDVGV